MNTWADEVITGDYAGHPGLLYRQRPHNYAELLAGVERWTPRTFLVQSGRRVRFGEFFAAVDTARNRLTPLGIRPGDRVMLLAYNSPDWVVALWAIWSAGAVPVLGNRWWSDKEAQHSLDVVRPRVVITDSPGLVTGFEGAVLDIATLADCFGADATGRPEIPGPADEEAPAVILFTSGSTGMPKAVELPFRAVVANQQNVLPAPGNYRP